MAVCDSGKNIDWVSWNGEKNKNGECNNRLSNSPATQSISFPVNLIRLLKEGLPQQLSLFRFHFQK